MESGQSESNELRPGDGVELRGLTTLRLNGQCGRVEPRSSWTLDRVSVRLTGNVKPSLILVKPSNLVHRATVPEAAQPAPSAPIRAPPSMPGPATVLEDPHSGSDHEHRSKRRRNTASSSNSVGFPRVPAEDLQMLSLPLGLGEGTHFILYVDGDSENDPGQGRWAAVLAVAPSPEEDGVLLWEHVGDAGCDATDITAVYTALLRGLSHFVSLKLKMLGEATLTVCCSTEQVVDQLTAGYAPDLGMSARLQCYYVRVNALAAAIRTSGASLRFVHAQIGLNRAAHVLASLRPDRVYDTSERVVFSPAMQPVGLVGLGDGASLDTRASLDDGAHPTVGSHLIDAETALASAAIGVPGLQQLDTTAVEVCETKAGRLNVLGVLSSLKVAFRLDATSERPAERHWLRDVFVVDHLPVPFQFNTTGGFSSERFPRQVDGRSLVCAAKEFPPTFRSRPFWNTL
eukprot:m.468425 g.468425  ORF g.468425 m.468425 type:complete len:458 (-) comp27470_c0_seq1:54-1427(-)